MTQPLLERGREAAAAGEWQHAFDLLMEADAGKSLERQDLAVLADVAYATGHLHVTIEGWERAHAQSLRAGDRLAAAGAATRVAMHLLFDTALMAPVRGWLKRAERLLEGQDETPVHAWLAVVYNYERLLSGDFHGARQWALRAIETGSRCNPAAAAVGRIAEARSLILDGEVDRGLELLNEAAVATVSGELDPMTTGLVYCELVCAMQALAQYDLAEEWTQAMEQWRHGQPVGSLHGRCRVHRAEILRLRGALSEAEQEALRACEELRPYLRREFGWPLTELGRIRLRMGDIDGAEQAFAAAHDAGWDPQPGLAMTYLARGEVARAAASIREALEHPSHMPSKELPPNSELRRAPLLEAQVEIAVAAGDLPRALWAADELDKIAIAFGSKALAAGAAAALARVRLAEGDAAGAARSFEAALQGWSEIGAPYETALAHIGLAHARRAEGNAEAARRAFQTARSLFERVGATQQAERAAHACSNLEDGAEPEQHVPSAPSAAAPTAAVPTATAPTAAAPTAAAPKPAVPAAHETEQPVAGRETVFRREGEYWTLAFAGRSQLMRDGKGLRYLAGLLADPGREFHVLDLVAGERAQNPDVSGALAPGLRVATRTTADEMLDAQAKDAYRRRLAEIEDDLEEARAMGDTEREAQAQTEHDILLRELSRAFGLGGRRRMTGSASERARASVTRAVRSAISRICEHHPLLGEHLNRSIRTGTYCTYLPDPRVPVEWEI